MAVKSPRIPIYIGQKLRQRRRALGLSQQQLAAQAGISFQQLQKYEQGKNDLNAQRLMTFASLLGVGVSYFFDGLEQRESADDTGDVPVPDTRETQALARHHRNIADSRVRQGITQLARNLAGVGNDGESGAGLAAKRDR